jgi:hypothetical protein
MRDISDCSTNVIRDQAILLERIIKTSDKAKGGRRTEGHDYHMSPVRRKPRESRTTKKRLDVRPRHDRRTYPQYRQVIHYAHRDRDHVLFHAQAQGECSSTRCTCLSSNEQATKRVRARHASYMHSYKKTSNGGRPFHRSEEDPHRMRIVRETKCMG